MANERLQGEDQFHSKNYLLEMPRYHAKTHLKSAPQKLNFLLAEAILKSYTLVKEFCMKKRLPNIFKTKNVMKLTKTILKSFYRILQESICLISCIIFEKIFLWLYSITHAKMHLKSGSQKLYYVMEKAISKSYTLVCSCKCSCMFPHIYA